MTVERLASARTAIGPAIAFEPDGYLLSGPKLMGRQAAGHSFLRAAAAQSSGQELWSYTPSQRSAEVFSKVVSDLDPTIKPRWCKPTQFSTLAKLGTLYWPGPDIGKYARLRLRAGIAAYSLCGITHTTASHIAMDAFTGLLTAPLMPWDALICTSKAVVNTVQTVLDAERDYLRWRLGGEPKVDQLQLPIIPLGIHCQDFDFGPAERSAARAALGIGDEEVVALFVGRLSYHAKAHPHSMYLGLQKAAQRTSKRIVLIQCGWFADDTVERIFKEGAVQVCPDVRCIFTNGKQEESRGQSWAAADLFISLSDNIQETFGLAPLEAMAVGLPVVVTDWDGYKDTVRDGVDGFRIPTWMPPPGSGQALASDYEAGNINYDRYCALTCQTVSMDVNILVERLSDLISNASLRQQLGEAGRKRARETFDWIHVYNQYQELWIELSGIRQSAEASASLRAVVATAPRVSPSRMDPFRSFEHYPTEVIGPSTPVRLRPGANLSTYRAQAEMMYFKQMEKLHPPQNFVERLFDILRANSLEKKEATIKMLVSQTGIKVSDIAIAVSVLSKMNLVTLGAKVE